MPFGEFLFDPLMINALPFVKFPKALANPSHEVDSLPNLLPRSVVGKPANGLNSCFLGGHIISIARKTAAAKPFRMDLPTLA